MCPCIQDLTGFSKAKAEEAAGETHESMWWRLPYE